MSDLLQANQTIGTRSGQPCTVAKLLGSGGQGEVYRVRWCNGEFALKWYYPGSATLDQRHTLLSIVGKAPSPAFLWPETVAESERVPGFGYVMRLREPRFQSLFDLMAGRTNHGYGALIRACIELTKAFRALHNDGLCYRDISFGNAFFDPGTGDVLVCDNDNVTTNGTPACGVAGTTGFMAPEVERGESNPSRDTDLHSLAVLLFHMLHLGHPLCGRRLLAIRCWDSVAKLQLYGREPLFIFDPTDRSNEAVPSDDEAGGQALRFWTLYPQALRAAFTKTFTAGLRDPKSRVTELEWIRVLSALHNALFRCTCGASNFHDASALTVGAGTPTSCWKCGKTPQLPFRIHIGKAVIMLNHDRKLFASHIGAGEFDFGIPVAEVVRHPTEPGRWGLRNLMVDRWVLALPDGTVRDVDPGKSVALASGVRIAFGKAEGEIMY